MWQRGNRSACSKAVKEGSSCAQDAITSPHRPSKNGNLYLSLEMVSHEGWSKDLFEPTYDDCFGRKFWPVVGDINDHDYIHSYVSNIEELVSDSANNDGPNEYNKCRRSGHHPIDFCLFGQYL